MGFRAAAYITGRRRRHERTDFYCAAGHAGAGDSAGTLAGAVQAFRGGKLHLSGQGDLEEALHEPCGGKRQGHTRRGTGGNADDIFRRTHREMDASGLRDRRGGTGGACNHGGDCGKRHSYGGGGRQCAFDARHRKQRNSHAADCKQPDSHAEGRKQQGGDGCHRQKPDCERRSAGFALLQQLHQGERHGDCEADGCFGKPRICRLLRHGRSSRRFDRYDRRRCEFCGKKCDFGFALL